MKRLFLLLSVAIPVLSCGQPKNGSTKTDLDTAKEKKTATSEEDEMILVEAEKRIYKVGDYYKRGKKEGVVFAVSDDGCCGKIISISQPNKRLCWNDAMSWCMNREGGAWYLADIEELLAVYKVKDKLNQTLSAVRGSLLKEGGYWSCVGYGWFDEFDRVTYIDLRNGEKGGSSKDNYAYTLAVTTF